MLKKVSRSTFVDWKLNIQIVLSKSNPSDFPVVFFEKNKVFYSRNSIVDAYTYISNIYSLLDGNMRSKPSLIFKKPLYECKDIVYTFRN